MNEANQRIIEILERKKQGIDCTEEESGEIKGWLRETTTLYGTFYIVTEKPSDQDILEGIKLLFPEEYGEFIDEMDDDLTRKGDRESYWQI